MSEEDRYTFSAVMHFIYELESDLADFYRIASERVKQTDLGELFHIFSERNLGRRDELTKVQRETVTEMTLEPIVGLNLKEYAFRVERTVEDKKVDCLERAVELEETIYELYSKVSEKVAYTSADVSETLNRFSQESVGRKNVLARMRHSSKEIGIEEN